MKFLPSRSSIELSLDKLESDWQIGSRSAEVRLS